MWAVNILWLLLLIGMFPSSGCMPTISGPLSISMAEEAVIGSTVTGLFDVTPGDPADVLVYSLTGSDTGYFQISAVSGLVRVVSRLDRDSVTARTVFNDLLLTVTDQLGASATASLTVTITDVNDNVPSFVPAVYVVTVNENTGPGQNLVTLACVDSDTTPGNGDITYAISGGDDVTPKFTLSANTLQTSANGIDYEALSGQGYMYQLIVIGTDGGAMPNTGSASIIIQVNPVNEENPVWGSFSPAYVSATDPYNVQENAVTGENVVTITATDGDQGQDGLITYSIGNVFTDGGNPAEGVFRVDPVSGQLMTSAQLDCDSGVLYYDVEVLASDQGLPAKTTQRSVRIGLLDMNDNPPMFAQSVYSLTVSEDVAVSTSLMTLLAIDYDQSSVLTYSIVQGNEALKFKLVAGDELQVRTAINLDRPYSDSIQYKLVIQVVDGGSPELTASTTVVITVSPVNDYAPEFLVSMSYNSRAVETSPIGHSITRVSAQDFDYGNQGVVSYSIFSGGLGHFSIDRSSGVLKLMKEFDFEGLDDAFKYVVVVANDGEGRTDTATLTVTIGDANDNKPICVSMAMEASLPEDAFTDTPVDILTVTCTDRDAINYVFYGLLIGDPSSFSVTSYGVLQRIKPLDYETTTSYRLVLGASDGTFTEHVQVMVTVLPVNEAAPVFSSPAVSVTWSEDTPLATTLITYTATDSDSGLHGVITYSISTVSSSGGTVFEVDTSSGHILLIRNLNYEALPAGEKYYTIVVTATDGGGLQGLGTVSVVVADVNDNSPSCFPSYRELSVTENTAAGDLPQTMVSSLSCTDLDSPGNLTFELTQTPPGLQFTIDSGSGAINLITALDYETAKKYTLLIVVQDSGLPMPLSTTVTAVVFVANVNDGPPTLLTEYVVSVYESVPIGSSVFDLVANDPDDPNTPEGNIVYSIVMGNYFDQFVINPSSGRISVNKKLDRESSMLFTLYLLAVEEASLASATTALNISIADVNDLPPRCTSYVVHTSVSETSPVLTTVSFFPCLDPDGSFLQFTLISGNTFVFTTYYASLILKNMVDYESATKSYDVIVRVSDGIFERDLELIIDVTPVNEDSPVFTDSGMYSVTVPEDTAPGTLLIQVSAVDADAGPDGTVFFSMMSHSSFLLDGETGKITLQNYLDYETATSHTLEVIAADMGIPAKSSTATVQVSVVDLNENPPVFNPKVYVGSVSQSSTVGSVVLSLTASDTDSDLGGEIMYSLLSGNIGNVFRVEKDDASGECRLIINDMTTVDDENLTSYELKVQASDGGGKLAEALVLLKVTYVNEFAPVFIPPANTSFSLSEVSPIGTALHHVQATDTDAGTDGVITYSLGSGHMFRFTIDSFTGVVSTIQELDREITPLYILEVLATDGGVSPSPLTATLSLTVHVTDVNDNPPVCVRSSYVTHIPENTPPLTSLAQLSCSDSDEDGPNSKLVYEIFAGSAMGLLTVDNTTGLITTTSTFDRETETTYSLSITVFDQGTPSQYLAVNILFLITDVNDNTPEFCCSPYAIAVSEDFPMQESVLQVVATDPDEHPASMVAHSILSGNVGNKFSIDSYDGVIMTSGLLDRESVDSYSLVILAKDFGVPSRSSSAIVTIKVNDVNDNAPYCPTSVYSAYVAREVFLPHSVLTIVCSDVDENSTVIYSLLTASVPFSVNSSTGELTVSEDLSDSVSDNYTLSVSAFDGLLTTNVQVIIQLSESQGAPVFRPAGPISVNITETTVRGIIVTQVTARATHSSHLLNFSITAGNTGNVFEMKDLSGVIQTLKPLDYENQTVYQLEVTVVDVTSSALYSSITTVTVNILDKNDSPPTCSPDEFTTTIPESHIGAVLMITCTDDDSISVLTYSIVSGNELDSFSIDPNSGELFTNGTLDYENAAGYGMIVKSTDGEFSSFVLVKVTVEPVNEYPPVFPVATYQVSVAEDTSPGTSILTVNATDQDAGQHGALHYSVVSGNAEEKFVIDRTSGVLTVSKRLDWEQTTSYNLVVLAVDGSGLLSESRSTTVPVAVTVDDSNDNFPKFTPFSYLVTVEETAPGGSTLLTVTASDDDTGENGQLTFSVVSGNDDAIFNMTGRSVVMNPGSSLNYATCPFHFLVVEARDKGTSSLSAQAFVSVAVSSVNKFPPIMVTNSSVVIAEDTAVGTVIFTISATDNDTAGNDSIVYSIISGNTPGSLFLISSLAGTVQVSSALDFDTEPTMYVLEILAQENHGTGITLSSTTTLSVILTDVNDNTPVFTSNTWSFVFEADVDVSTPIGTVVATDGDSGPSGNITYTMTEGNATLFSVDSVSGEIRAAAPGDPAYRRQKRFSLMISATDAGSPPLSSETVVLLSISDDNNPPVFIISDLLAYVSEQDIVSTQVLVMQAIDSDSDAKGWIFYSVSNTTSFTIDSSSGVITLKMSLDRETNDMHVFEVIAEDGGSPPLSATCTVTIVVQDTNDNRPVISGYYNFVVPEDSSPGIVVTKINASDADAGENAALNFEITSGNSDNVWVIERDSGVLKLLRQVDHETLSSYTLMVNVRDKGIPSQSTLMSVTVIIEDVNDFSPVFSSNSYSFTISEDTLPGSSVGFVKATDKDTGVNSEIEYALIDILSGGPDFTVDSLSGDVLSVNPLDRETLDNYVLVFRASDKGRPKLYTDVQVTIAITDINDNSPVLSGAFNGSVMENCVLGTSILQVLVCDDDYGQLNGSFLLSIVTDTREGMRADELVAVNSFTGLLTTKANIDREADQALDFMLEARDQGTPPRSSSAKIHISVMDENDNPPVMNKLFESVEIAYDGKCTGVIVSALATDADWQQAASVTYYMNDASGLFFIDQISGDVQLMGQAQIDATYILDIGGIDNGSPRLITLAPMMLRVDALDLEAGAVSFALLVTKDYYIAHEESFLNDLTAIFRSNFTYQNAVAKRWCIEVVDESASNPAQRRRLLTAGAKAVLVHIYILQDGSPATWKDKKVLLSSVEALSFVVDETDGSVLPELLGGDWARYGIFQVTPYRMEPSSQMALNVLTIGSAAVSGLLFLVVIATIFYYSMVPVPNRRYSRSLVKKHLARIRNDPQKTGHVYPVQRHEHLGRTDLQKTGHVYPVQRQEQTDAKGIGLKAGSKFKSPKSALLNTPKMIVMGPAPNRRLLADKTKKDQGAKMKSSSPGLKKPENKKQEKKPIKGSEVMNNLWVGDGKSFSALSLSLSSNTEIPVEAVTVQPGAKKNLVRSARPAVHSVNREQEGASSSKKTEDKPSLKDDKISTEDVEVLTKGDKASTKGDKASTKGDKSSLKGDQESQEGDKTSTKGDKASLKGDQESQEGDKTSTKGDKASIASPPNEKKADEMNDHEDEVEEVAKNGTSSQEKSTGSFDKVAVDPASGRKYKYNSVTLETKWMDTPDDETENDGTSSQDKSAGSFDKVAVDPASGRKYKYNSVTGETKWIDTPDDETENAQPGIDSMTSVEHVSSNPSSHSRASSQSASGRKYRYNSVTGETKWIDAPDDETENAQPGIDSMTSVKHVSSNPSSHSRASSQSNTSKTSGHFQSGLPAVPEEGQPSSVESEHAKQISLPENKESSIQYGRSHLSLLIQKRAKSVQSQAVNSRVIDPQESQKNSSLKSNTASVGLVAHHFSQTRFGADQDSITTSAQSLQARPGGQFITRLPSQISVVSRHSDSTTSQDRHVRSAENLEVQNSLTSGGHVSRHLSCLQAEASQGAGQIVKRTSGDFREDDVSSEDSSSAENFDKVAVDPASGRKYKYSSTTMETRWIDTDGDKAENDDASSEDSSSSGTFDKVAADTASGRKYKYSSTTMETRWIDSDEDKPENDDVSLKDNKSSRMFDKVAVDPVSGRKYKYSSTAMETRWVDTDEERTENQLSPESNSLASVRSIRRHHSTQNRDGASSALNKALEQSSDDTHKAQSRQFSSERSSVASAGSVGPRYSSQSRAEASSAHHTMQTTPRESQGKRMASSEEKSVTSVEHIVQNSSDSRTDEASLVSSAPSQVTPAQSPEASQGSSRRSSVLSVGFIYNRHASESFDKMATDPVTGQMYKYSTRSLRTRWIENPYGGPIIADDFQQVIPLETTDSGGEGSGEVSDGSRNSAALTSAGDISDSASSASGEEKGDKPDEFNKDEGDGSGKSSETEMDETSVDSETEGETGRAIESTADEADESGESSEENDKETSVDGETEGETDRAIESTADEAAESGESSEDEEDETSVDGETEGETDKAIESTADEADEPGKSNEDEVNEISRDGETEGETDEADESDESSEGEGSISGSEGSETGKIDKSTEQGSRSSSESSESD